MKCLKVQAVIFCRIPIHLGMKWRTLLMLWMVFPFAVQAQPENSFSVDSRAIYFPASVTHSSQSLANYILKNFHTDEGRIRAAYRWVTANIRYDKDSMLSINWSKENDEKIAATLRRKKGVCDNFASLFTDILVKMDMPAFVVSGYCRTTGSIFNQAHSWTAVKLKENWVLCDPTWDINYAQSPRYFLIPPEDFIQSHWPFDPLWQLLPHTVSYQSFERGFAFSNEKGPALNVGDSVRAFAALDQLQQMEAAARRMKAADVRQGAQNNWYAYNQMNIAIIHGERNMQLYNAAVNELNEASKLFNKYAAYRNDLFQPARPDEEIREMLYPVKALILAAKQKTTTIASAKENFQYDTGDLSQKLATLNKKVDEQISFLMRYVSTDVLERQKLFYR